MSRLRGVDDITQFGRLNSYVAVDLLVPADRRTCFAKLKT